MPSNTSGISVVEGENRRHGEMSQDEMQQCISDISSWFKRKAKSALENYEEELQPGDLQGVEKACDAKIPPALRFMLKEQNGGLWFNEYRQLTAEEIIQYTGSCLTWSTWKEDYIPFAVDPDLGLLVIKTGGGNKLCEISKDMDERVLSDSFLSFLESYRNKLLSNKLEYIEDVGMVERTRK